MSFEKVQKSASSTLASTENSAVSLQRKLSAPSASPAPEISAQRSPMTTAQWLQSDLVMRTIQGFERKEAADSAPARSDQNASSVQLESVEQPESDSEEQIQTKAADSAPARSDKNASSVQLEALEQPESDSEEQVQTKLTVGQPGDPYEQEADSMAAKVMAMPESAVQESIQRQNPQTKASEPNSPTNSIAPALQRSATGEEEEIQMKSGMQRASDGSIQASKSIESHLADSKGGGSPLPKEVRGFMEPRFGADFGGVKVHTGSNAVQMNKDLGAQAFARGSDIYYGAGKSPGNNELTAHELTHTIQQTGAKQLSASSTVSLRSNKETFQTNSIAPPSLDSPAKTLPETEKSPPETQKTTPSQPEQKAAPEAAPQPEKAENANAPEKQNAFGLFGQLGQIKAIAGKLESVLSGAGGVIWSIVKDPVGFLGNLVAGLRQGFGNFYTNVNTHLQTGLIGWLTGTLGPMGIQIPEDVFSLKGAFSMVTQVLGVTWDYIRTKAVKQFGERTVVRMEKSSEIFQMLAKGPMGLWEQASARFDDLKETTIEQIKNTIATQVIQAGLKWIMSLLNPASGLVKAAFAIYDIVMFFTQRASQMVELVQAATGAVQAVASGSVGGAASMVENALARSIPVAIGFMANLLGINGLATKVQEIVQKVRTKVDGAIDGVLLKAKNLSLKEKVKGNKDQSILDSKDDRDSQVAEQEDPEHNRKVTVGLEQLEQEQTRYLKNDAIVKEDAQKVAMKVKAENPVFKSITVADNKETWDYIYVASPPRNKKGPKQANNENTNLSEEDRIASILKEHGYSQKEAEQLSQQNSKKLSKLKAEIEKDFYLLIDDLEFYSKLPKKIEELDENQREYRKVLEDRITKVTSKLPNQKLNKLANQSVVKNVPISMLLQITGSNDYLKYHRLYAVYQQKKQAYDNLKQDTKDEPQSKQTEQLEEQVEEAQKSGEPMKILKTYGYNWDVARDALAYANGEKRGKVSRKRMETLVDFRSRVVLKVLNDAMRNVGSKIPGADVIEFTHNSKGAVLSLKAPMSERPEKGKEKIEIHAIAPGSSNLTSDYDVTFQIEQLPQHEAALVIEFNQVFGKYFVSMGGPRYESGVVFDTNVYTSGFFGKKGSLYKPKTTEASEELTKQQLAFSLVAILKGLPQEEWGAFEKEVIKEATDVLRLNSDGVKTIHNLFEEAKIHTKTTNQEIDKQKEDVMTNYSEKLGMENNEKKSPSKETTSQPNKAIEIAAQMHAANRLYEEQIKKVSQLIQQYKTADKAYNPEAAEAEKQKKAEEIDKISTNLYKEQSLALIYANEAYYSAGPILHVVGEMQMGLKSITTKTEYLQSLLVQAGYKLQHIQHYQHLFQDVSNERGKKAQKLDRVGLLFAKYGYRAIEALNEISSSLEATDVMFDLSQESVKSIAADLEMEYIKKAGNGTPQEKVSQAVKAGSVVSKELKDGKHLNLEVMQSSWKELAIKVLARIPHLLNHQKSE